MKRYRVGMIGQSYTIYDKVQGTHEILEPGIHIKQAQARVDDKNNGTEPYTYLTDYKDGQEYAAEWRATFPEGARMLFAYYTYEDYSGTAFGLYEQDGKLYEVNGSHCSCYGLEDQWQPEEASVKELRNRAGSMWNYYGDHDTLTQELVKVLDSYEQRHHNKLLHSME